MTAVRGSLDRLLGTAEGPSARCPVDDWEFHPRFTGGVCPLCGWKPEGVVVEPAILERADWFLVAFVVLVLASVVMAVLVARAWTQL